MGGDTTKGFNKQLVRNNIQNNIVDEVSNKEEIKKVMEAFPDSKITSISKVDNRNESK